MMPRVPGDPGTYVLLLSGPREVTMKVGRLGRIQFQRGFYTYAGSALGPGGLAARIGHHLRSRARPRWHIDYLRRKLQPVEIWYASGRQRRECQWAAALERLAGCAGAVAGFGCSDCACSSHLLYFPVTPCFREFQASAGSALVFSLKKSPIRP